MADLLKQICPSCRKTFRYPPSLAGRTVSCPGCKYQITLPSSDSSTQDAGTEHIPSLKTSQKSEISSNASLPENVTKLPLEMPGNHSKNFRKTPDSANAIPPDLITTSQSLPPAVSTDPIKVNLPKIEKNATADKSPKDTFDSNKSAQVMSERTNPNRRRTIEVDKFKFYALIAGLSVATLSSLLFTGYVLINKPRGAVGGAQTSQIGAQGPTLPIVESTNIKQQQQSDSTFIENIPPDRQSPKEPEPIKPPAVDFVKERSSGALTENLEVYQVLDDVDQNIGKCFVFDGVTIWFDVEKTDRFDGFQMSVTDRRKERHSGFGNTFLFVINKKMADAIRRDFPANRGCTARIFCQILEGGDSPIAEIFKFASLTKNGEIVDEYYDDGNWKYIGGAK
jgi:hypothetical protein